MSENNVKPNLIEGFVEILSGNIIQGWINSENENFTLCAFLGGINISDGVEYYFRADVTSTRPSAKGFEIKCNRNLRPSDFIQNELKVIATNDYQKIALPCWPPLHEAGVFSMLKIPHLKLAWHSVPADVKEDFLREIGNKLAGRGFGRVSRDGVAQVGRNGFYFLVSGRNHLSKLYTGESVLEIERWVSCFERRREVLVALGIRYVQLVLPEKSSVLHEFSPFPSTAGSPSYIDLIARSAKKGIPLCNVLPKLLNAKEENWVYPQGDTHLSTFGAEIVVKSILDFLGENYRYDPPTSVMHLRAGDLSGRFVDDGDIQELERMYQSISFKGVQSEIKLVDSTDPSSGHQGRRRVWRSSTAPIQKKVVCFGNSFFERGDSSGNLSWWFARLFSEFHFIWSPDLDMNYVQTVSPDIVVCQTIERFLTEIPDK